MFNPETWALDGNWSWLKICQVAEAGLSGPDAKALVRQFGPSAPLTMVRWCEKKVAGTCAMAGWEWDLKCEDHRDESRVA